MAPPNKYVTLHGFIRSETTKAWLFQSVTWSDDDAQWLPKSQCKIERDSVSDEVEMQVPEWLYEKNDFDKLEHWDQDDTPIIDYDDAY